MVNYNVYGKILEPCSSDGMAKTGYTRNGSCALEDGDIGNHHICIDISSVDQTKGNFCEQTKQPDWCSSDMSCHNSNKACPVNNWCICQWAFADYIENSGGCENINNIYCESTNSEALKAYKENKYDPKILNALECIEKKCNI